MVLFFVTAACPVVGLVPAVCLGQSPASFWGWSPLRGVPACESTPWSQHSHDAAGTSTSNVRTRGTWDFALAGARRWVSWYGKCLLGTMTPCEQLWPSSPVRAVFHCEHAGYSYSCSTSRAELKRQPATGNACVILVTCKSSKHFGLYVGNCTHLWDSLSNMHSRP